MIVLYEKGECVHNQSASDSAYQVVYQRKCLCSLIPQILTFPYLLSTANYIICLLFNVEKIYL